MYERTIHGLNCPVQAKKEGIRGEGGLLGECGTLWKIGFIWDFRFKHRQVNSGPNQPNSALLSTCQGPSTPAAASINQNSPPVTHRSPKKMAVVGHQGPLRWAP